MAASRRWKKDQQLLRKSLPGYLESVVFKAPPDCRAEVTVNMHPPLPPMSNHDARVAALQSVFEIQH